jgi:hypothetical protein
VQDGKAVTGEGPGVTICRFFISVCRNAHPSCLSALWGAWHGRVASLFEQMHGCSRDVRKASGIYMHQRGPKLHTWSCIGACTCRLLCTHFLMHLHAATSVADPALLLYCITLPQQHTRGSTRLVKMAFADSTHTCKSLLARLRCMLVKSG